MIAAGERIRGPWMAAEKASRLAQSRAVLSVCLGNGDWDTALVAARRAAADARALLRYVEAQKRRRDRRSS